MTQFEWKILQTSSIGDQLVSVNYLVTAKDEINQVQSQGHADMTGKLDVPYEEIRESTIVACLEKMYIHDQEGSLKKRLQEQLDYLKNPVSNDVPWKSQIFSVQI